MKKYLLSLILLITSASLFAQLDRNVTLSKNVYDANYSYYSFPVVATTDYITGYTNYTGLTYTVTLNKDVPTNVVWYLELDSTKSASGTDSINVDVKLNFKHFDGQATYTTLKTIAVDLDGSGDYKAVVADSSYIVPTGSGSAGNKNVSLLKADYANVVQLSITPTTGPGVGKINDKVVIKKVYCRVKLR